MTQTKTIKRALLLIGPTGAGKSPLGMLLEEKTGWAHFDFGHRLRMIASGDDAHGLNNDDVNFIRNLLEEHALFPDERFGIVEKIIAFFLNERVDAPGIILNGLPRHTGQAKSIAPLLDVCCLAVLNCSPEDIAERIIRRKKGLTSDHSDRSDDTPKAIAKKIEIFHNRTKPLIDFYRERGIKILDLPVSAETDESDLASAVRAHL
jgi:adenylate kinase